MHTPPRVRFAPSPTGPLHIGGARTALFNWAFAKGRAGAFLLRSEDTDRERSTEESERGILDGLRSLGLQWDEGPDLGGPHAPYRQSERLETHLGTAGQLRRAGWAYPCFCTSERLTALREAAQAAKQTPRYDGHCRDLSDEDAAAKITAGERFTLRFKLPEGETVFTDAIRGEVTFAHEELDDWIMVRADGSPTYNFVCVCDDLAMGITHVIRGEEHLVNTPKQILLFQVLGREVPTFAHLPLMLGKGGKKMSKRDNDTALAAYIAQGFPPEAILNYLALQGWALDGETEIFTPEVLVENFRLENVGKSGSIFDLEKFSWMAGEYLRAEPLSQTAERALPFVLAAGFTTEAELRADWPQFEAAVATTRERVRLYSEIPAQLAWLYEADDAVTFDEKAEANARKHGAEALALLGEFAEWVAPRLTAGEDAESLITATKAFVKEHGVKFPFLFQPLRCALTGKPGGPEIADLMALLGPERTAARLTHGARRLA